MILLIETRFTHDDEIYSKSSTQRQNPVDYPVILIEHDRAEMATPSSFNRTNCSSRNSNLRDRMIEEELANDMNY